MMSRLKGTMNELDRRLSDWATPKSLRRQEISSFESAAAVAAPSPASTLAHVSEADLEAAVLALRNMKQLSAWVKENGGAIGYAAGGAKPRGNEAALA